MRPYRDGAADQVVMPRTTGAAAGRRSRVEAALPDKAVVAASRGEHTGGSWSGRPAQ